MADEENDEFACKLGFVKSGCSGFWNGWSVNSRLTVWGEG